MEPGERLARDRARRAAAEELTTMVLDELVPTVHRLRVETAIRLGLSATDLVCLDLLRRHGPLTSELIADRTGLDRSAVSKMVRRLERAGHVDRSPDPGHLQRVRVALAPHEERDRREELLRSRMCAALTGAPGLDRPRALTDLVGFLTTLGTCLHRVATAAATSRWARRQHAERQRQRPVSGQSDT